MVDLSDPKGPVQEGISNTIFIVPAIIVVCLVSFFGYKLVSSIRAKEKAVEEKKKLKAQRREIKKRK